MNSSRTKRLQRVTATIEAMPLAPGIVDAAFERFCETGDLPDHDKVAALIVERALAATKVGRQRQPAVDLETGMAEFARLLDRIDAGESIPQPRLLREDLFHEAMHATDFVRSTARAALRRLVQRGGSVTDTDLLDGIDEPSFGTVGLWVLGFPGILVRSPHKLEARRVLARFVALRERVRECAGDRADEWFTALAAAGIVFRATGELPEDAIMRDAVAANAALLDLVQRCIGGHAGPGATNEADETAGVLGALLLAAQAGDTHASRVLLARVGVPPARRDAADAQRVGPPIPEGKVLIDQARCLIALAEEFAVAAPGTP